MDWRRLLPQFWFQNAPTDRDWDEVLNRALDRFDPEPDGYYSARIGPLRVWTANWPYAYGSMESGMFAKVIGLPTVRTRIRLRDALRSSNVRKAIQLLDAAPKTPKPPSAPRRVRWR